MAAKLSQNGIQFNEIQASAKTVGAVLSHSPYLGQNGLPINNRYTGYIQEPTPYINAIDINWDGAVLEKNNKTIRTSADLLNQLEVIYEKFGDYAPKSVEDSIESFTEQLTEISSAANQALDLVQNFEQIKSDWNESNQNSPAFILNKPVIPTSVYNLNDWNDFATQEWVNNRLRRFNSAYDIYVEQQNNAGQTPLSQEEWINSLHGTNGLSAYELAVNNGLTNLSEIEWIKSLKAKDGWTAYEIAVNNGFTGTEQEWLISLKGETGERGKSNYDIAVDNGFEGSEQEWLESIKGEKGEQGIQGNPGKDGNSVQILDSFDTLEELYEEVEGKYYTLGSAYLVNGYLYVYKETGSTIQEQWKNVGQIKGDQGIQGEQGQRGKSNYDIYKELAELNGEIPLSESDWLESLRGQRGKSNYDIYKELAELNGEIPLSESDWLESLKGNSTYTAGSSITISENNVISLNSIETWSIINN